MLVSVIIPVFNGEKYIREAIDSVLNQTFKGEYEIIVINDGSTDGTKSIMEEYHDKVTQIDIPINKGTARTLNIGIKEAKGDWIKWLGADDVLLPDALEVMMGRIEQMESQGYDIRNAIYYTNYYIMNAAGERIGQLTEPKDPPDLWLKYYGSSSTALMHKSIFDKCGLLDESLDSSEDYEFWLRATKLHGVQLKLIPVYTLNYRRHEAQLTEKTRGKNDPAIREKIKSQLTAR